jgi:hypothetical protein
MDTSMVKDNSAPKDTVADAMSTIGLILNLTAVIASVICLAGLSLAQGGPAVTFGIIALVSFAVSLGCFSVDSRRFSVDVVGDRRLTAPDIDFAG